MKKDEFMKTHPQNVPAAANRSWQHGGPRQNAYLSLWTKFWRFRPYTCMNLIEKNGHVVSIVV